MINMLLLAMSSTVVMHSAQTLGTESYDGEMVASGGCHAIH